MNADKRARAAELRRAAGVADDPPQESDEQPPEPPEPLAAIPRFPVDRVCGPLRSFIEWGIKDGLHPECVAAAGLSALVTLTGPARLKVGTVKTVKPILWIALIGSASAGKSPAYEHAFNLMRQAFTDQREQYEAEYASWQEEREALGKKAGPSPARPEPFELDDTTTEAVARWLITREPDPSGAVIDDELAAFLEGLNQYKGGQGSDLSKWLKLWTGAPLHIQRVGKGGSRNEISLYVPEPVVSVSGPLVPDNIHLLGKPGSGFRPRWLPFYAPAQEPSWNDAGAYPEDWEACIGKLAENRAAREWVFNGKARTVWEKAKQRWRDQQSKPEPDDVIEALRKADAQCLRIALVIAESIAPGAGGDIPAKAVAAAVAIVDYCASVWRALPGNSTMTTSRREDVMDAAHRRLMAWLETRPKGTEGLPEGSGPRPRASRRELQRWLHEPPAKIDELIAEHMSRWPGCVVTVKPDRGPAAVLLYAPPRMFTYSGQTVAATVSTDMRTHTGEDETPGQDTDGKLSRNATVSERDSFPATVYERSERRSA